MCLCVLCFLLFVPVPFSIDLHAFASSPVRFPSAIFRAGYSIHPIHRYSHSYLHNHISTLISCISSPSAFITPPPHPPAEVKHFAILQMLGRRSDPFPFKGPFVYFLGGTLFPNRWVTFHPSNQFPGSCGLWKALPRSWHLTWVLKPRRLHSWWQIDCFLE